MRDIEKDLDNLRSSEQIKDWSVTLGYGDAEYTIDLKPLSKESIKLLAKRLKDRYGAHSFVKYEEHGQVAVKFVVDL